MNEEHLRAHVIEVAHSWLGTPFHDCARIKGVGVDCACLIAEVFAEAGLIERVAIPTYSPQFFLHQDEPILLSIIEGYTRAIPEIEARPADLVIYKFGRQFSHCGLIIPPGWPSILHAYKQDGRVTLAEGLGGHLERRARRFYRFRGWA